MPGGLPELRPSSKLSLLHTTYIRKQFTEKVLIFPMKKPSGLAEVRPSTNNLFKMLFISVKCPLKK